MRLSPCDHSHLPILPLIAVLFQICFWLLENGLRVLIAACDTFRSGAVEQLRTHTSHLSALHPLERRGGPASVMLYERGYGKDAAGIAMEAIHYGVCVGQLAACGCDWIIVCMMASGPARYGCVGGH